MRDEIASYLQDLQNKICSALEALEAFEPSTKFSPLKWSRPGGGGGESRILSGGKVFEKAGVNISVVHGELPARMQEKLGSKEKEFFATGISLVIHPHSPQVPTVHANFRYFEQPSKWWFGGGADLTPYVPNENAFKHFHQTLKMASVSETRFQEMKEECDKYFFIPHRGETRGVGGIFFDYVTGDKAEEFKNLKKLADAFISAYCPIVEKTKDLKFSERQKKYQLLRRGRYVEFNLVYDRGTLFGLETKGNIESILMSLPPCANWDVNANMEETPEEKQLLEWFKKPASWI